MASVIVAAVAVVAACAAAPQQRAVRAACEAGFWLLLATTAFNPWQFFSDRHRRAAWSAMAFALLVLTMCILSLGSASLLAEKAWRAMDSSFTRWQLSVFGSAVVHAALTFILSVRPILVQNTPHLQRFKIQQDKAPASVHDWTEVFVHIGLSQLFVQLPLVTGQYIFVEYFQVPFDYDSIPSCWSLAWRLVLSLIVDDTWVYFGHRFLHDKRIYKHIHKFHHTYQSPFAIDAEYEHPVETVFLGIGFFTACTLFTNHLLTLWAWLYVRLLVTYDSHLGYDLPLNIFNLLPGYNGAREHDWHHKFFNGNYAPTFVWWDQLFGTSAPFHRHEVQRRAREAAEVGAAAEERGDRYYAEQPGSLPHAKRAGVLEDSTLAPLPFTDCLVTGSEGLVGQHLVRMLAERGAKRIVCLDKVEGPTEAFTALADKCRKEHSVELQYVKKDITALHDLTLPREKGDTAERGPFVGVQAVFHLAALVGPYFKTEMYDAVNRVGAMNVLEAFVRDGGRNGSKIVLVDCSTPSTRYFPSGDIDGPMEHELSYQDCIHEYATTKASGEKALLAANGRTSASGGVLATCAVAPHQVYAPEDTLFLPPVLENAQAGLLRIVGTGENLVSFTHADNVAHAMAIAATKLWHEGAASPAAGEFFVVTDGEVRNFWDTVIDAVVQSGIPSPHFKLKAPLFLTMCVAYLGLLYTRLTGHFLKLSPFSVRMLVINRHFCTAKARHMLGYAPVISFKDGWAQTVAAARKRMASKEVKDTSHGL